jgi:hypothetical protein
MATRSLRPDLEAFKSAADVFARAAMADKERVAVHYATLAGAGPATQSSKNFR